MTPSRIAGAISRQAYNDAVADVRRRMQYQEKHDSSVKKFNRLMKPITQEKH